MLNFGIQTNSFSQTTNQMYIVNLILPIVLLLGFVILVFYQLRNLITKIDGVKNGAIPDKRLAEMIRKAESSGKNKFTLYRPFAFGLLQSCVFVIFWSILERFIFKEEISLFSLFFMFLWTLIIFSVWGIIVSRKVWNLCRQE